MAFDFQPTLNGPLVRVRPLRADDFEALYEVARDPLIWEQHPVPDRWEREKFTTFFEESLKCGGALLVVDARSRAVVGSSRFHGYDEVNDEVEIGWTFLARSHWRGDFNRALKQMMVEHAHQHAERVVLLVAPTNVRSLRAVEKIGGVRVGSRDDAGGRPSVEFEIRAAK